MYKKVLLIVTIISIILLSCACGFWSTTANNEQENFRFVVAGDSRGGTNGVDVDVVNKIMESVKKLSPQPKFMLILGDLVNSTASNDDMKKQIEYFKTVITEYYPIDFFYPGMGNHEMANNVEGHIAFSEVFTEFKANFLKDYMRTVYYFDYGETRFFMLDSNYWEEQHIISDAQLEWLKSNLLAEPGARNMFFVHEPPYPTGSHVGSSLDVNPFQRDKLWQIVDSARSPMLFCAHEHTYSRRHINSDFNETISDMSFNFTKIVYQVTTGGFGPPTNNTYLDTKDVDVPPLAEYNYAVVDIDKNGIRVRAYTPEGDLIDDFSQP
jgi:hypothetical protein